MTMEIPESARKPLADFERTKAALEKLIEQRFSQGDITSLGTAILGLPDKSHGSVFHPTFEKVLTDRYAEYLLAHFAGRISVQIDDATRRVAKQQAKEHVRQLMKDEVGKFTGDSNLKERARELLTSTDVLIADIRKATEGVGRILAEIDRFRNIEFIRGVLRSGALVIVDGERSLRGAVRTFEAYEAELSTARRAIQEAVDSGAPGGEELVGAVSATYRVMGEYFPDRGRLSMAVADAYKDMTVTINEKMLDAYVYAHSESVANLKGVKEIIESGAGVTEAVLRRSTYSGFFVRLAEFVNIVGNKAATELAIREGSSGFKKDRAPGSLFEAYDKEPQLLFQRLQDNQLAALDMLISMMGFTLSGALLIAPGAGEVVTGIYDLVTKVVKDVVKEILRGRAEGAMAEIRKLGIPKQPAAEESFWTQADEFWDKKCKGASEEIEKELKIRISEQTLRSIVSSDTALGVAQAAHSPGGDDEPSGAKFDPIALVGILEGWIITPVTRWVLQYCEIRPAQFFTGTDLATILTGINRAQLPVGSALKKCVVPPPPLPVDPKAHPGLVPEAVNGHRVIATDASRSNLAGAPDARTVHVALALQGVMVWGSWLCESGKWFARDIHRNSFADWSGITVIGRDCVKENNTELKGTWHAITSPGTNYTYIGFRTSGGDWRLGHYMDLPKGPRAPEFFLGTQTERFWVRQEIGDLFTA